MKICMVHNEYGIFSGEECVVYNICHLLEGRGHTVIKFFRSSTEIPKMRLGKARAFCSGIYSFPSKRAIRKLLSEQKPDIVHIHNLFPFISPSILGECKKAGISVVMTVHNYRLFCPIGLYMINGQICEKCNDGEYWCVLRNCTGSLPKSIGYALRMFVARKLKLYYKNVAMYAVLTEFQRQQLISKGLSPNRIVVIPNMITIDKRPVQNSTCDFVGFVGRVSPEKGVSTLVEAANQCGDIAFKASGDYNRMPNLPKEASKNFEFCGHLSGNEIRSFYLHSRVFVLPSIWYEGFPNTLLEAMAFAKPVICSRIGGLPEIVDDGITGLLFEPGNADDLAEKIRYLWDNPELRKKMGHAGREKALREYSPEKYYERLMAVYKKAIELGPGGSS